MPSTAYNVDVISRAVGNFSRPQIVQALNEVCMILYSENMRQTVAMGEDGQIPTIFTVAGTYKYNMAPNVRQVAYVVGKNGVKLSDNSGHSLTPVSDGRWVTVNGYAYLLIPTVSTVATHDSSATITFISDPGTEEYRILYFKKADEIETESDPIPFPDELHRDIRACVIAMLNVENYGQTGVDENVFQMSMSKVRTKLNKGTQNRVGRTGVQLQEFTPIYGNRNYQRRYGSIR